jgi:hypothetical protein
MHTLDDWRNSTTDALGSEDVVMCNWIAFLSTETPENTMRILNKSFNIISY